MRLEKKQVTCECGATYEIDRPVYHCTACGRQVFHSPAHRRRHRLNTYYVYGAVLAVITFIVYIFIEMIANPLIRG